MHLEDWRGAAGWGGLFEGLEDPCLEIPFCPEPFSYTGSPPAAVVCEFFCGGFGGGGGAIGFGSPIAPGDGDGSESSRDDVEEVEAACSGRRAGGVDEDDSRGRLGGRRKAL